jgi:hypothetical protein
MFVEEGFRIRFGNGELIDFYADSRDQKEGWMTVLAQAVGKEGAAGGKSWCSLVLKREENLRRKGMGGGHGERKTSRHAKSKSMII